MFGCRDECGLPASSLMRIPLANLDLEMNLGLPKIVDGSTREREFQKAVPHLYNR